MTSAVLPDEDAKISKMRQKDFGDRHVKEESRSFLTFSRENLSISNSDLEQGFNKHRFRTSRNTILSTAGLLIALLCLGLETWELRCSLTNARKIEELKRDVESLKHRFVEKDLLDELKAFGEQLYAEDSTDDDDDTGEMDIDNADYDTNYEDDSSWHDYSAGDYRTPPTYGSRASDFPEGTITSGPMPTPPDPQSSKALEEILAAVRKKHGTEFEKSIRESHRRSKAMHQDGSEERNSTRQRRHAEEAEVDRLNKLRSSLSAPVSLDSADDEEIRASRRSFPGKKRQTRQTAFRRKRSPNFDERARPEGANALPHGQQEDVAISDDLIALVGRRPSEETESTGRRTFSHSKLCDDTRLDNIVQGSETSSSVKPRRRRRLLLNSHLYAAHYHGDREQFSHHAEHTGNDRVRHHELRYKTWKPSDWVSELNMQKHFSLQDGQLVVRESGLYLVYAQIHYLDTYDESAYHVTLNNRAIFQCTIHTSGSGFGSHGKNQSCFSAQVVRLRKNDVLEVKQIGSTRYTVFSEEKSFFGLVMLGRVPASLQNDMPSTSR